MNLTLETDIPGDVMWSLIDSKHIVPVPHHDGLFVDRVHDCLDVEIDGRTEDFVWYQGGQPSEWEWRDRGGHHSVSTKVWLLISETPLSHEIKDESGVISKGWCVRGTLSSGFIKWCRWTWRWLLWTSCWTYISGVNLFYWCSVDGIPFSQAESFQHSMMQWCGMCHVTEWACVVPVLLFGWEVYLVGSRNVTCRHHLYVMVINNERQGHIFQNMKGSSCVDLASNVPTNISTG